MMNQKRESNNLKHDVTSHLGALLSAFELIQDEWESNPQLVDQIVSLSAQKIVELQKSLDKFHNNH